MVGVGEHGVDVLGRRSSLERAEDVRTGVWVEQRCVVAESGLDIDNDGKLVEIDDDSVGGVLGLIPRCRDGYADCLADIAHGATDNRDVRNSLIADDPHHGKPARSGSEQLIGTEDRGTLATSLVSKLVIVPCGTGLRISAACRVPGISRSSKYRPPPSSNLLSLTLGIRSPTRFGLIARSMRLR